MQDAHHTSRHRMSKNHTGQFLSENFAENKADEKPISFLGYGVDIFQSRFTPYGKHGFLRAPFLISGHKKSSQYHADISSTLLSGSAGFRTNCMQSRFSCNTGSMLSATKLLGKILAPYNLSGAFHQEIMPFLQSDKAGIAENFCFGLNHFNQPAYSLRLPQYSKEKLRQICRKEVLDVIDGYCQYPESPIKRNMLFSLFEDYGSFICTGAIYGGMIRQETTYTHAQWPLVSHPLDELALMAFKEKTGQSLTLPEQQALDFSDFHRCTRFSFHGGESKWRGLLDSPKRKNKSFFFKQWCESVRTGHNPVFIDFMPGGLIPVWLLAKTTRHEALIRDAFSVWFKKMLIKRHLLPEVITRVVQIERDAPLDAMDTAGFTHRTSLIGSQNNRYFYLGYDKEPAHMVMARKGSIVSSIHPVTCQRKAGEYLCHHPKMITHGMEVMQNQYGQTACFSSGMDRENNGTALEVRVEPLSFDNLSSGIGNIYVSKDSSGSVSLPIACQKVGQAGRTIFTSRIMDRQARLHYLPV